MDDCIFCEIANKTAPAEIVFENDLVIAFRNVNPVASVHLLIIPKKHIEKFMDADGEIFAAMTKAAQQIISDNKIEDAYKLVINGGRYQAVPHLHWHLLAGKLEETDNVLNKT